ncbi:AfsR/SARP family transcriptional regulator [Streptomyces sp. TRM70308]|uniref:AfsR/SARP family transcriptional regulator n=1 Tax=Streptomyces sp. TRM70308 TaxID=3131932 RepID=UPI003CFC7547
MTQFRILGPVEVYDAGTGRRVTPPGVKQRTLLAVLAAEAGRPVTVDRLADELWGEDQPLRSANAVQAHVARLRRLLDGLDRAGGPGWIGTEPLGYVLRLGSASTDARTFQRLSDEGRAAAAADPERAVRLLRRALALWRGPALQDCRCGPLGEAEAERLEERRLTALESLYAALLRSGRPEAVAAELERLTDEHPLRESFYALLIRALDGAGRPAEALSVYERARRRLAHQLGTEPGRELRARRDGLLRRLPSRSPPPLLPPPPPPRASAPPPDGFSGAALLDLGSELVRLRQRVEELTREQARLRRRCDELAAAARARAVAPARPMA